MLSTAIILATYCPNLERYDFCEQSFGEISQTGVNRDQYELVVVNNGGIHGRLIESLNADLVISNSHNVGQAAALNIGIAATQSINLVLVDDDLSYKEGWLYHGLRLLNRNPDQIVSLVDFGDRYIIGEAEDGRIARKVGGNWIFRRRVYEEVGRFASGHYAFGGLYTRNLRRKGYKFLISKEPYITHLGTGASIVGRKNKPYTLRRN